MWREVPGSGADAPSGERGAPDSVQDVPPKWVSLGQQRVVKVIARRARHADYLMAGVAQQRHQPPPDGTARAGEKNPQRYASLLRRLQPRQSLDDLGLARQRLLALFLFLFDDFFGRAGNEIGIVELGIDAGDVGVGLG